MRLTGLVLFAIQLLGFVSAKSWRGNLYDWGVLGPYPRSSFKSSELMPPHVNVLKYDERCSLDYVLLTPRGSKVSSPGSLILDARGELVWMEGKWGETMDMKIQHYRGEDYITFWVGVDDGTHGRGTYFMVSYKLTCLSSFSNLSSSTRPMKSSTKYPLPAVSKATSTSSN